MPELPEVETVKRALEKSIENKRIIDFYHGEKDLRFPFPKHYLKKLKGNIILKPFRIGKYCILPLSNKKNILLHLGMSGKILILNKKPEIGAHDHVLITLEGEIYILYNDQRRFGFIDIIDENIFDNKFIKKLGPEALSNKFNGENFYNLIQNKDKSIKSILLDQSIVAGLGNIYVNEVLFASNISPKRKGKNISKIKSFQLVKNVKKILKQAIKQGGTTIKDHIQPDGNLGYFKQNLKVYGRTNDKCLECDGKIKEIKQLGRSSFFCESCQR
jgi:formamidopyrimidine-DNA glycosylase